MKPGEMHEVTGERFAPAPERDAVETVAPHVGGTQQATRGALARTLRETPSLDHLAHYTGADWDFSYDADAMTSQDRAVQDRYQTVGCNLIAKLSVLSGQLTPLGTGALIRTVLQGPGGAIYCDTVMQGERILGVTHGPLDESSPRDPRVVAADKAIAGLIRDLREDFGVPTQNHGGYENPQEWAPPSAPSEGLKAHVRAVLHANDLQFVALVNGREVLYSDDVFDEPDAERFFRAGHTVAFRRSFYAAFAADLGAQMRNLARIVHPVIGRHLRRTVLDVQRGAIYLYRIDVDHYLMGITLNQSNVYLADLKMGWLRRHAWR